MDHNFLLRTYQKFYVKPQCDTVSISNCAQSLKGSKEKSFMIFLAGWPSFLLVIATAHLATLRDILRILSYKVTSLLLLLLILFPCCMNKEEQTECAKPDLNPNGSSELSVLMRKMHEQAAEMKKFIEEKKSLGSFPEEFNRLTIAAPTDSTVKKPSFDAFAENYLSALKSAYESDEKTVKNKYNAMVNACLSCHGDHCPGPVPKIKKLMIEKEK